MFRQPIQAIGDIGLMGNGYLVSEFHVLFTKVGSKSDKLPQHPGIITVSSNCHISTTAGPIWVIQGPNESSQQACCNKQVAFGFGSHWKELQCCESAALTSHAPPEPHVLCICISTSTMKQEAKLLIPRDFFMLRQSIQAIGDIGLTGNGSLPLCIPFFVYQSLQQI